MAEIFIRQLIDDLDGKPIDTGLEHEVTFSYQGTDYRIDLRPTNADKIGAVFAPYIKAARSSPRTSRRRRRFPLSARPGRKPRPRTRRRALADPPSN
ncbi:Lsr2 dimerization domain-containing protein [Rhodococcus globerulus]|uniref:Lsr2 dimerization domain-containing protein n=1 Tax=Rhodococcus globerulus TaxID=33008 RepID=UPI003AFA86E9